MLVRRKIQAKKETDIFHKSRDLRLPGKTGYFGNNDCLSIEMNFGNIKMEKRTLLSTNKQDFSWNSWAAIDS